MITRPLDLASRLRPEPRSFDWLFYVNGGAIVLFFSLFGSRFVLAPGLGVNFRVPTMPGALAGAAPTTHRISVVRSDLVFVDDKGAITMAELRAWLRDAAKKARQPSLLVLVGVGVPTTAFAEIASAAYGAGFVQVQMGAQEPTNPGSGGR